MESNNLEEYINKLKKIEQDLNDDNSDDLSYVNELNGLFSALNSDIYSESQLPIKVPIKKLHPNAVMPTYSKEGDAGMDLTSVSVEHTEDYISYKTGLSFEIPSGYVGLIFPRSSNSKKDLLLTNSVGVIDSGYRGEIQATFKKTNGLDSIKYNVGDRGAQIIIMPYPKIYMTEVPELSDTERGSGGFGSTGK